MANTSNPQSKSNSESDPNQTFYDNVMSATGMGFQIGIIGDTAFQFVKGLSSSSSPKGVSGFHRLGGACKNVRLRPYSTIIALVAGAASLHKANDEWLHKIKHLQDKHRGICPHQTLKEWFCGSALDVGSTFPFGIVGGSIFHLYKAVNKRTFPCHGRRFDAIPVNTLLVTGKVAAWVFLTNTLAYALCVSFHDNKEMFLYISGAVAAGLLSVRRGLPAAATITTLTGGVGFFIANRTSSSP